MMNEALQKEIEELGFVVNPEHPDPTPGLKLMKYGYIPTDDVIPMIKNIKEWYPPGCVVAISDDGFFMDKPIAGVNVVGMYKLRSYNAWRAWRSVQLEVLFEPLGE
jgi:hypothetical protein